MSVAALRAMLLMQSLCYIIATDTRGLTYYCQAHQGEGQLDTKYCPSCMCIQILHVVSCVNTFI